MDFANQSHKQTRPKILENLTLTKNDNANESDKILQTQFTRTKAKRKQANFENLHKQTTNKAEATKQSQSKPTLTKTQMKNIEADFSDSTKPT